MTIFRLHFEYSSGPMEEKSVGEGPTVKEVIEFEPHVIPSRGPYPFVLPKKYVRAFSSLKEADAFKPPLSLLSLSALAKIDAMFFLRNKLLKFINN